MTRLRRNKKSQYLTLYVPKREEKRLGLNEGDEVDVHLYLLRKAPPKNKLTEEED